jgi:hypothetical protein
MLSFFSLTILINRPSLKGISKNCDSISGFVYCSLGYLKGISIDHVNWVVNCHLWLNNRDSLNYFH